MNKKEKKVDFQKIIEKDRKERITEKFSGTFLDYLDIIKKEPILAQLAHGRMYDMITKPGSRTENQENSLRLRKLRIREIVRKFEFFDKDFFGMDRVINQIVRYFHSASMGGEESRQVLYLVGPVGAGKSSLMEKLKAGLELSKHIYAIDGCPMHEEPLHLIPNHLREEFSQLLGITIEGDLCPICRFRLKNDYDSAYEKFPVETINFSIKSRNGVGVVPPVDPNNQDTSVLIGSEDISKMDIYAEDDPRVLSLNGAFNAGNRGLVEFIEVFKNETEYLHAMITATQEKLIPAPGRNSMIYFDGVILAHSNEAEWEKFKADHTNEAILDRIVKVEVPYVLELDEEVKIYGKILSRSRFDAHMAPHTIEVASMFSILTRLQPTNKCDLLTKLKLYNGEEVIEKGYNHKIDVEELRENASNEGMSGISTRFVMKAIDNAISDAEHNCINPIVLRESMIIQVKEMHLPDDVRKRYLGFLQDTLHKEYLVMLEKEITKAFVHSYQEQAESLFQNYLDHAEAYVNRQKVKDINTKEELEPDEKLMRSIEEQLGITASAADGFRQDVTSFMFSLARRGQSISYKSYTPLKEAIEKKLMASVRDLSRIVTKTKTRDKDQSEKYDIMVQTMIEQNGYCPFCCETILKYSANNLWKD